MPLLDRVQSTVLFNPGSATERRWHPHFGIGLIRVTEERFTPDLIVFTDPQHLDNVDVGPESP
jgi:predicted phosphodiesterase